MHPKNPLFFSLSLALPVAVLLHFMSLTVAAPIPIPVESAPAVNGTALPEALFMTYIPLKKYGSEQKYTIYKRSASAAPEELHNSSEPDALFQTYVPLKKYGSKQEYSIYKRAADAAPGIESREADPEAEPDVAAAANASEPDGVFSTYLPLKKYGKKVVYILYKRGLESREADPEAEPDVATVATNASESIVPFSVYLPLKKYGKKVIYAVYGRDLQPREAEPEAEGTTLVSRAVTNASEPDATFAQYITLKKYGKKVIYFVYGRGADPDPDPNLESRDAEPDAEPDIPTIGTLLVPAGGNVTSPDAPDALFETYLPLKEYGSKQTYNVYAREASEKDLVQAEAEGE